MKGSKLIGPPLVEVKLVLRYYQITRWFYDKSVRLENVIIRFNKYPESFSDIGFGSEFSST